MPISARDDPTELRRRLRDAEVEIERVRTTLEVTGTLDLDAGVLNRNGVLEALERGGRWLARRGDVYGLLVAWLPGVDDPSRSDEEKAETLRHLSATISAGVREVDEVGRIDRDVFGAVLMDLQPDSAATVADRVTAMLTGAVASIHGVTAVHVGAVEVRSTEPSSVAVLEAGVDLVRSTLPGVPAIHRL